MIVNTLMSRSFWRTSQSTHINLYFPIAAKYSALCSGKYTDSITSCSSFTLSCIYLLFLFSGTHRSGMRESVDREIKIPHVTRSIFLLLLEYLYTDSVTVEVEQAIDLYAVADLYQLHKLCSTCRSVLKWNLTTDNATILLQHASDMRCYDLKDICMDYIIANFDVVSKGQQIKTLHHELLLEILANRP